MEKVAFMDADGIITDQLGELKATLYQMNHHPSYADQILQYLTSFSDDAEN